jgi:hypothetical protein
MWRKDSSSLSASDVIRHPIHAGPNQRHPGILLDHRDGWIVGNLEFPIQAVDEVVDLVPLLRGEWHLLMVVQSGNDSVVLEPVPHDELGFIVNLRRRQQPQAVQAKLLRAVFLEPGVQQPGQLVAEEFLVVPLLGF